MSFQPELLPQQQPPKRSSRQSNIVKMLLTMILIVGMGGFLLNHWVGGDASNPAVAAHVGDYLNQTQQQERVSLFQKLNQQKISLRELNETEIRNLSAMSSPISASMKQGTHQRIVELTVWDDVAEDGDVVHISSLGQTYPVMLQHTPQVLYFPTTQGEPIRIIGVHDGGGGITLGFTGSGQPIALPVLAEGQSIDIFLK